MKKIFTLIILISILCLSGCSTIHVGGSGRVGDVSGSGEGSIPMPDRD
ncbi:MAG: entericidin [Candidatus Omnitrophica bacterium]|nr:entericidin [Candidatus Omnitrophota bacterium]